jgi:allantoate deiminase/N-carbamoyl-L-amino-acid hydrolase
MAWSETPEEFCSKGTRETGNERDMRTNSARVIQRLEEIYRCGSLGDGTHARLAFSKEDILGRKLFMKYFKRLGIEPNIDSAGNITARVDGSDNSLPAILTGSHLDTVPDGGKYDGALGCVAGLEVAETMIEYGIKLRHPFEVTVFTDEEGARFGNGLMGSCAFCGADLSEFKPNDSDKIGVSRKDILESFGVHIDDLGKAARPRDAIRCFIELHIEQGGFLDDSRTSLGVVTAIAGVRRFEITVKGLMNHAGSTMMPGRKDALVAASRFISSIGRIVSLKGGPYSVATVGVITVEPNSINVIPGVCSFSLEIRDQESHIIERIWNEMRRVLSDISEDSDVKCEIRTISSHEPVRMNDAIMNVISASAEDMGIEYLLMPSGAFHDSLVMAGTFPSGMIFIPSANGVSHSPEEFSSASDIQTGCDVLMNTILRLDKSPA